MKRSYFGKLMIVMVMVSLLLTGCSLLPTSISDTMRDAVNGGGETVTISREEYERLKRYAEMDELLQWVEALYYQDPNVDAMIENAERGLLYGLEDPYTFYYNPEQYAKMWEEDEGEYAGIGIQLMGSYETYLCTITRVFLNTPAHEAGLRKGDILVQVEDIEVTAYNMDEAVDIMRGEVGQPVTLQVKRGDQFLDFVVNRDIVHINWTNSCMLDEEIGYIALYEFSGQDGATEFKGHLDRLMAQGAKGLVLDLRDNPGGWVEKAIKIADLFLPEETITYTEMRDGTREYYKGTNGDEVDIPMVVLINENSASASEILAGALQDYKKATIVGVTSFGKGVVQYVLPVGENGAGMQLTVSQYFTPNGNEVHKVGIKPDVEVEMPEGVDTSLYDIGDMDDVQVKKAYEVVQQLIAEDGK